MCSFRRDPTIYNIVIEHSTNAIAASAEPACSVPSNEKEVQTISQTVVMTAASESSNGDPLEAGSLPNGNVNPNFGGSSVEMEPKDDAHEGRQHKAAFFREAAEVLITTSNKGRNGGRLPPPRTLRKCVLINNDCKYSLQKPTVIIRK